MLELLAIGLLFASCSGPETTRVAMERATLPRLDPKVSELAPDGRRLAIATVDHRVLVVTIETGAILAVCEDAQGEPMSIDWRADGERLAMLDRWGEIHVFDAASGRPLWQISTASTRDSADHELRVVSYAARGRVLVAALGTPAEFFQADEGVRFARVTLATDVLISAVAVSRDGKLVALGDTEGRVGVWDARTATRVYGPIDVPPGTEQVGVHALDFHPDGRSLAIGGGDCIARIWPLGESAPTRQFSHCDQDVFGGLAIGDVQFSPDGTRLLTTSYSWWETRLWDTASGQRLGGHECRYGNDVSISAFFTADGRFAVTSVGGIVIDAGDGSVRHTLEPVPGFSSTMYRASGALAWGVRGGLLRVCDVGSGLPVFERATE